MRFLLFLFLFPFFVFSQDTTKKEGYHVKYSANGNGSYFRGNSDRIQLVYLGNLTVKRRIYFFLNHYISYAEQAKTPTQRDFLLVFSQQFFRESKVHILNAGMIEGNHLRGIEFRYLAGAGIGLRVIKLKNTELSLSNCLMFEETFFINNSIIRTIRSSFRVKTVTKLGAVKCTQETYLFPSLIDLNNFRLRSTIIFAVLLNKKVSVNTTILNTYETIILPGKQKYDLQWTFGFSLDL